jgi:hypothetical protein
VPAEHGVSTGFVRERASLPQAAPASEVPNQESKLLFIGDDWAEDHHDVEVQDTTGRKLTTARLPEGVEGIAKLHELVAKHGGDSLDAGEVVVSIETDRGPWVQALLATGYQVYAVNPKQAARFKERYGTSGAKSDKDDAHALAGMVRIDRDQLRPIAGDTEQAEAVKVVARAHQSLIWDAPAPFLRRHTELLARFREANWQSINRSAVVASSVAITVARTYVGGGGLTRIS